MNQFSYQDFTIEWITDYVSPDQDEAMEWLIEYVLPFANAKDDKEIIILLLKANNYAFADASYMTHRITDLYAPKIKPDIKEVFRTALLEKSTTTKRAQSHTLIKDMLTIRLAMAIPEAVKKRIPATERQIKNILNGEKFTGVSWRSSDKCIVHAPMFEPELVLENVTFFMVRGIAKNLYAYKGNCGSAIEKVGMCPNCGIFFNKKRKDQEYCSRSCKSIFVSRKFRNKNQ